jgi:hypothetical protein
VVINPQLSISTNEICLNWAAELNATYHVEGLTNIISTNWVNLSGPIVATNATSSFCIDLPTPFLFFQVIREGGTSQPPGSGSTNEVPANEISLLMPQISTNGQFQLSWDAVAGAQYEIRFTTNLASLTSWTALTNITASTNSVTFADPTPPQSGTMRFYQVVGPDSGP